MAARATAVSRALATRAAFCRVGGTDVAARARPGSRAVAVGAARRRRPTRRLPRRVVGAVAGDGCGLAVVVRPARSVVGARLTFAVAHRDGVVARVCRFGLPNARYVGSASRPLRPFLAEYRAIFGRTRHPHSRCRRPPLLRPLVTPLRHPSDFRFTLPLPSNGGITYVFKVRRTTEVSPSDFCYELSFSYAPYGDVAAVVQVRLVAQLQPKQLPHHNQRL